MIKEKVLKYLENIPCGKVVTYAQIGEYLGNRNLCRAIGNILHNNPDGKRYPCYRVVNSEGRLSDNYAFGGIEAQRQKLEKEGIEVIENRVDLNKYQYREEK
ncbi:MAG: MGMT family protein [Solobacterium sp.]|nr:MGMT family protein [Solobacterium sp.]